MAVAPLQGGCLPSWGTEMKKTKIIAGVIVLVLIALVSFQNKVTLEQPYQLTFNSYMAGSFQTPPIPRGAWFFACFLTGFLLSFFTTMRGRIRSKRTVRELKTKNESMLELISQLREELASGQPISAPAEQAPADAADSPSQTDTE
jgi:uncharacterized integral membrane protein